MESPNPPYSNGGSSPSQPETGHASLNLNLAEFNDMVTSSSTSSASLLLSDGGEEVARFTLETFVTLFTTLVCVVGNSLILLVGALTTAFDNFNRCYLFSLTLADLFLGLLVTSFCIFNSVFNKWIFQSEIFCCVQAYLLAIFVVVSMVSLAFLIVDHYVAVRKPDRHPVMMSFNRSLCWMILAWVVAISFCCPPLFDLHKAIYYAEAYLCIIDGAKQQTYFLTVTFMVTVPATVAVLITSRYLFTHAFQDQKAFYQRVYEYFSERTWNYYITFVIAILYFITWLPFTVLRVAKNATDSKLEHLPKEIHFYCVWFGLSNCFTKFIVYLFMSPQFRQGLREVCYLQGGGGGSGGAGSSGGGGGGRGRGRRRGYVLCGRGCGMQASSADSQDPEVIMDSTKASV